MLSSVSVFSFRCLGELFAGGSPMCVTDVTGVSLATRRVVSGDRGRG